MNSLSPIAGKPALASKTLWANALAAAIIASLAAAGIALPNQEIVYPVALAAINFVLRLVTSEPIGKKK